MATQMSSFLLASLAIFLFLSSLEKSFAFQATREDTESNNLHQYTHLVQLSSLLPSSSCSSSTKGPKRKASLEVVHKHGPCSQLNHDNGKPKTATSHSDILDLDKERVKYIHSRLSKELGQDNGVQELDSATLPAKSGSLIGSGNYFVVVGLGTPKRDLSLIFDTGSDLTWTQCEPCARSCYKQQDAIFDPSKSSSYSNITCTSTLCTQLSSATGNDPGCSASTKACIYGIQYGDQSFSVGYFSRERLAVTATDVSRQASSSAAARITRASSAALPASLASAATLSPSSNKLPPSTAKSSPIASPPPPAPSATSPSAAAPPLATSSTPLSPPSPTAPPSTASASPASPSPVTSSPSPPQPSPPVAPSLTLAPSSRASPRPPTLHSGRRSDRPCRSTLPPASYRYSTPVTILAGTRSFRCRR
ncbi:aspartic protease in guard cell 2 [Spatholobus suberectus]|nr:aspartic protease in guard cell 2 [Spatholobus suberectus]